MIEQPIEYDAYGRMKYHPSIHAKQKTSWLAADQKYLIERYESDGPEQVSLALERTIGTILTRVCALRKAGVMPPKPAKRMYHKRLRGIGSEI